jgi:hypothetical protein
MWISPESNSFLLVEGDTKGKKENIQGTNHPRLFEAIEHEAKVWRSRPRDIEYEILNYLKLIYLHIKTY